MGLLLVRNPGYTRLNCSRQDGLHLLPTYLSVHAVSHHRDCHDLLCRL